MGGGARGRPTRRRCSLRALAGALALLLHTSVATRLQDVGREMVDILPLTEGARGTLGVGTSAAFAWRGDPSPTGARQHLYAGGARQVLEFLAFRYHVVSSGSGASCVVWGPRGARRRLLGHESKASGIRAFPMGDRVLTWSSDATAIVWDTASGELETKMFNPGPVKNIQVFPDGERLLAWIEDGTAIVWDTESWLPAQIVSGIWRHVDPSSGRSLIVGMEIIPGGERVLTWGEEPSAAVWDLAAGDVVCAFRKHTGPVKVAKVFPDSARVVTGGMDGRAMVWDISSCSVLHKLVHSGWVMDLALLDGGRTLATSSTFGTALWSTESGRKLRQLSRRGMSLLPFPDGRRLLLFGRHLAVVWDASTRRALHRLVPAATGEIEDAAISAGGDVLATCGGDGVAVWDMSTGALLGSFREVDKFRPPAGGRSLVGCLVSVVVGRVLDPQGFGQGVPLRELPGLSPLSSAAA
mmetsp:Transcript_84977/g.245728  ORF Transcript_84977/g.245728 Transcript_84977/m.245728 type:complete len:468 (+) Transcript_84977:96-1499(+)